MVSRACIRFHCATQEALGAAPSLPSRLPRQASSIRSSVLGLGARGDDRAARGAVSGLLGRGFAAAAAAPTSCRGGVRGEASLISRLLPTGEFDDDAGRVRAPR
jgi:hypothetical protein